MNKRYRNVTSDALSIQGEYSYDGSSWVRFSGRPDLMRISHLWETGTQSVRASIWKLSDGYGPRGLIPPQGYDWSGIRDSSREAIADMLIVAKAWQGNEPWPWELPEAQLVRPQWVQERPTPGPWELRPGRARTICDPHGVVIAEHISANGDGADANARLISVAPDLLEACRLLIYTDDLQAAIDQARVALSKTGLSFEAKS